MLYGYVRDSTAVQTTNSQKSVIARFVVDRHLTELFTNVSPQDTVIVSELSRLGRSIREVLRLIEELIGRNGGLKQYERR